MGLILAESSRSRSPRVEERAEKDRTKVGRRFFVRRCRRHTKHVQKHTSEMRCLRDGYGSVKEDLVIPLLSRSSDPQNLSFALRNANNAALTIDSTRESITEESFNSSTVFEESSPKLEEATTFQSTEQIFERIGCFEEGYKQQECGSPPLRGEKREGERAEPGESTEGRLFREFLPKSWPPLPPPPPPSTPRFERALEDPADLQVRDTFLKRREAVESSKFPILTDLQRINFHGQGSTTLICEENSIEEELQMKKQHNLRDSFLQDEDFSEKKPLFLKGVELYQSL
ncbi:hypothetical protein WN51_02901 [Melipona quadrifasciata]|uniref:Uncharacterized protein n=1 Tax=Melipona quadrifasciata TaxID=166423 RepID=A0A0M9A8W7_9HYME|nr:hypothetical protein WN51_02901 [Melipona quadrifasciata]